MIKFAFYGRVSTEDRQDPAASRAWQLKRAGDLVGSTGEVVSEFFDIGQSRSLPWQRRPEASRLLASLADPTRNFEAVVIGEPQRAFSGSQYSLTYPLFVHHGVQLWVPEVGGPVDPESEAHDMLMTLFGGMSKGERNRIRTRVRTAMSTQAKEGRFLGGRPPYGYLLADDGEHPNPEKARIGQRLHKLEPDPETAPVVVRIFQEFIAGRGYAQIAGLLTDDGILSPSGHDPDRNRHRSSTRGVWGKAAVRAILENPRYTGYSVWAKQRRDEVLLDAENVSLGYETKLRWNAEDKWVWSDEPTHEAIISEELFEQARRIIGSRVQRRKPRRTDTPYLFRSLIFCKLCGRRMQGNRLREQLHYRCVLKQEYPGSDHPRSLSVREELITPIVDDWLGTLFHPESLDETCQTLEVSQDGATCPETVEAERIIKECDRELANYRAALRASPSDSVAAWIVETEARRKLAVERLQGSQDAGRLTSEQIRQVVEQMNGIVGILNQASPEDRRRIYQACNLKINYDHDQKAVELHTTPTIDEVWSNRRVGDKPLNQGSASKSEAKPWVNDGVGGGT